MNTSASSGYRCLPVLMELASSIVWGRALPLTSCIALTHLLTSLNLSLHLGFKRIEIIFSSFSGGDTIVILGNSFTSPAWLKELRAQSQISWSVFDKNRASRCGEGQLVEFLEIMLCYTKNIYWSFTEMPDILVETLELLQKCFT